MADKDTSTDDDTLDTSTDDVETDQETDSEDEDTDTSDQDDSDDDTESDDGDEDSDESDEESDEDDSEDEDEDEEPEFKKAFSQIKGETPDEYIPNLEEAYRKSSREGKKLATDNKDKQNRLDLINAAVAKDPALAKAILEATGEKAVPPTVDPAVAKVRQDYEDQIAQDLETFMKSHPDLEGDEDQLEEFMDNVAVVGAAARAKGRIIDPAKAYKRAWGMMDHPDDSKEKLANAAKDTASKSKSTSTKKTTNTAKAKLSADQIAYGKKMGLTEKQLLATLES